MCQFYLPVPWYIAWRTVNTFAEDKLKGRINKVVCTFRLVNYIRSGKTYINMQTLINILRRIRCKVTLAVKVNS